MMCDLEKEGRLEREEWRVGMVLDDFVNNSRATSVCKDIRKIL